MNLDNNCKKCGLYRNQKPIVLEQLKSDVMWVGISAQKNKNNLEFEPLDIRTNSGKFIKSIEDELPDVSFYKTNLAKCLPLDEQGKIRYPSGDECELCFNNFLKEISTVKPRIIFLLGNLISGFVCDKFNIEKDKYKSFKYNGIIIVSIDHPSYLMIYKRKKLSEYREKIIEIIKNNKRLTE